MDHYIELIADAVSTIEENLYDAANSCETAAERRKVANLCNRLAKAINETRAEL